MMAGLLTSMNNEIKQVAKTSTERSRKFRKMKYLLEKKTFCSHQVPATNEFENFYEIQESEEKSILKSRKQVFGIQKQQLKLPSMDSLGAALVPDYQIPSTSTDSSTLEKNVEPIIVHETEKNVLSSEPKKIGKTAAERTRMWRERKKAGLKQQQPEVSNNGSTISNTNTDSISILFPKPKKIGKTSAERTRLWRERKRAALLREHLIDESTISKAGITESDDTSLECDDSDPEPPTKKQKLDAEVTSHLGTFVLLPLDGPPHLTQIKESCVRLIKLNDQSINNIIGDKVTTKSIETEHDQEIRIVEERLNERSRISAENVRELQNKQDIPTRPEPSAESGKRSNEKNSTSVQKKGQRLSGAERTRKCRAKQKLLKEMSLQDHSCDNEPDSELCDNLYFRYYISKITYDGYTKHMKAHIKFHKNFYETPYGHECVVCERLWFKNEIHAPSKRHITFLKNITNANNASVGKICSTCKQSFDDDKIPALSTINGFKYPPMPAHLPKLDFVSERLISRELPFVQVRRLRHVHGRFEIYGQVINIPTSMNTSVNKLPRNINNDHCIYVNVEKKKVCGPSQLYGLVNYKNIKTWMQYLVKTPLYKIHKTSINTGFFKNAEKHFLVDRADDVSEEIPIEESLVAQQHTLVWNDEKFLKSVSDKNDVSRHLFDDFAEELYFPTIYLGEFREFRNNNKVTPMMIATSELTRKDRRGIVPQHLLYVALKIMHQRSRNFLKVAQEHATSNGNIDNDRIESEDYMSNYVESNLSFLRSIPNSIWHWAQQKKDLFAMIRQKGLPLAYITFSANNMGWPNLLKLLYKLSNGGKEISEIAASELSFMEKSTLVNEDAVTCVIYFNKLVNLIINILQSKESSPFGRYRVTDYFKCIDFERNENPQAHILLWLETAPRNVSAGFGYTQIVSLTDILVSVSTSQASGHIKLQTHEHTSACYKKKGAGRRKKCKFGAPFMPCNSTMILSPMRKTEPRYHEYVERYNEIKNNLETTDYQTLKDFYAENLIWSDTDYQNILRAGIKRPTVFYKRQPSEKWHNTFNPFVLSVLKSKMDFQVIVDKYTCATCIAKYVNKSDRGVSDLRRRLIEIMDKYPNFNDIDITKKLRIDLLNCVEMNTQEAAWYLLREPISKSSANFAYINTVWPAEREKFKKTLKALADIGEDSMASLYEEDWFAKYEKRPSYLNRLSLAEFVSNWYLNKEGKYVEKKEDARIIRYRNYDIVRDYNEYKREMVTLHIPFRKEETDILRAMKYINVYNENEDLIAERKSEFESYENIQKIIETCRQLDRDDSEESEDEDENQEAPTPYIQVKPIEEICNIDDSTCSDSNMLFLPEIPNDEPADNINGIQPHAIAFETVTQSQESFNDSARNFVNIAFLPETSTHGGPNVEAPNDDDLDKIDIVDELHELKLDPELSGIKITEVAKSSITGISSSISFSPELWIDESTRLGAPANKQIDKILEIKPDPELLNNESSQTNKINCAVNVTQIKPDPEMHDTQIVHGLKNFMTDPTNVPCSSRSLMLENTMSTDAANAAETDKIDIVDEISQIKPDPESNILFFSGFWTDENVKTEIADFRCTVKFKCEGVSNSNVEVRRSTDNTTVDVTTPNMEIVLRNIKDLDVGRSLVGNTCAARYKLEDQTEIFIIIIYINPDNYAQNIINFLHERLFVYTVQGSKIMADNNCSELPLVIAGNFNVDFGSKSAEPLVQFFREKFEVKVNADLTQVMTECGKRVDVVFSKHLDKLSSKLCISYTNCDRLIISFLESKMTIPII